MTARRGYSSPYRRYGLIAAVATIALTVAIALLFGPEYWLAAWIAAISVVTFAAYGFDKSRARSDGERIPELVLHALALAGGFPGGWLGRAVFRHKTLRASFTVVLAIATALWARSVPAVRAPALWLPRVRAHKARSDLHASRQLADG